jgi:hypothetical protein
MKAWAVGAVFFTLACIAAVANSPVFTGTWIVKNGNVGMIRAIVLTVGIAETGPLVRIRHVSASREDELYREIHDAARISRSSGPSTDDALKENRHWGGGRSWCNGEDCHRFYIFVGSALRPGRDTGASAMCQLPAPSILEDPRRI